MLRTPYLPGESDMDQLKTIFRALGTPTEEDWPVRIFFMDTSALSHESPSVNRVIPNFQTTSPLASFLARPFANSSPLRAPTHSTSSANVSSTSRASGSVPKTYASFLSLRLHPTYLDFLGLEPSLFLCPPLPLTPFQAPKVCSLWLAKGP